MNEKEQMTLEQDQEELIRIERMYESLRYNDYSVENGLEEIVDNSVEAGASKIGVYTKQKQIKDGKPGRPKTEVCQIVVADDGCGMSVEELRKCLVLGESMHPLKDGKRGIGRFGVGMTMGSISLARRVEVYSRPDADGPFYYTFIDLDDIGKCRLRRIPTPVEKEPDREYVDFVGHSSGTIVVLSDCDRVSAHGMNDTSNGTEAMSGLANHLGRTYRKFIAGGLELTLDGKKIYLHDPLYMAGPTVFDVQEEGVTDLKAQLWGETKIELPVTGGKGETAAVTIKISLLPKEWRVDKQSGGGAEAKKRKIDQNEGVSILRADREVLYGRVSYITGPKGEATTLDIDRWWGCEISFPPELDDYFQVRYIKRGAEPVPKLLEKIRNEIQGTVSSLRKIIRADRAKSEAEQKKAEGAYDGAEAAMARAERVLTRTKRGAGMPRKKHESTAEAGAEREQKKAELREKPYSIEPINYPQNILFETDFAMEKTIVHINVDHSFYKKILLPLCGPFDEGEEPELTNEKRRIRDAIGMLLLAYARAEAKFGDPDEATLFQNLRSEWGTVLAAAMDRYDKEGS